MQIQGLRPRYTGDQHRIDAVDQAADPEQLVTGLLRPLAEQAPDKLRLLLGTRDHLLRRDLLGPRDGTAYVEIDLDSAEYADPAALGTHIRSILLANQPTRGATQSPVFHSAKPDIVDAMTEAIKKAAGGRAAAVGGKVGLWMSG